MISVPKTNIEQDLVFKTYNEQDIELTFLPPTVSKYEKAPVYFLITGGGWCEEDRHGVIGFMQTTVDGMRESGFAVISIDYRVVPNCREKDNGLTVFDQFCDVSDALCYISDYADVLKIDSQKIIISGHSAGGHLSSQIAFSDNTAYLQGKKKNYNIIGCVPLSPITKFYDMSELEKTMSFNYDYIFKDKVYDEKKAHEYSPFDNITASSIPTLFVHGTHDNVVNFRNSLDAYKKGMSLGADFDLLPINFGGHLFENRVDGETVYPSAEFARSAIVVWCQKLLKK